MLVSPFSHEVALAFVRLSLEPEPRLRQHLGIPPLRILANHCDVVMASRDTEAKADNQTRPMQPEIFPDDADAHRCLEPALLLTIFWNAEPLLQGSSRIICMCM